MACILATRLPKMVLNASWHATPLLAPAKFSTQTISLCSGRSNNLLRYVSFISAYSREEANTQLLTDKQRLESEIVNLPSSPTIIKL